MQLKFIFQAALPSIATNLADRLLVDVGSRLGAVLYGAYHFSPIKKIVGVEINLELCNLQQEITEKYRMHDRVEIRCADICSEQSLMEQADIVILNNVFEFFFINGSANKNLEIHQRPCDKTRMYFSHCSKS